ncbi:hypothetical protein V7S57_17225 [Caulobacter sp. CCNWLY153]|uniref:hypothetical protein n=2 Tax=Caulobacter TaxID=75 RepID=UPI003015733A
MTTMRVDRRGFLFGSGGAAAPYAVQHVRLTPSIMNNPAEVDRALAAVRDITRA